jgi:ethanolamine utilization protein EutN
MKLGKVTGRVVSTVKVESFEGIKLMLVQPLDENLEIAGDPIVAFDTIQAGVGDLIYYETSKEAGRVLVTTMNPCDAAIMGIVDVISVQKKNDSSKNYR